LQTAHFHDQAIFEGMNSLAPTMPMVDTENVLMTIISVTLLFVLASSKDYSLWDQMERNELFHRQDPPY